MMDISYTIPGIGGYTSHSTIGPGLPEIETNIFDLSHAVQVCLPASLFNQKLGIFKQSRDSSNGWILDVSCHCQEYYDFSSNTLHIDQLEITSAEFIAGIGHEQHIMTVGGFTSAYADFTTYVRNYFQLDHTNPCSFTSLMNIDHDYHIHHGIFDTHTFWELISTSFDNHHFVGSIYLSDITQILRYAVEYNPFGNRDSSSTLYANAIDPVSPTNYGIVDGFLADDLICIPRNGCTIQFQVNIDYRNTLGAMNVNLFALNPNITQLLREVQGTDLCVMNTSTMQTKSFICHMISTPLLIRLI
jgi:hypothetical protein